MTPQEELELLMLMSGSEKETDAPGIFSRIMTGMGDVIYGGGQLLENTAEAVAPGIAERVQGADEWLYENTRGVFGSPEGVTMDDKVNTREEIYQRETGIMPGEFDGARLTGQIVSSLAAPLVRGLPALMAEGALFNAAMPTTPNQQEGETYWGQKGKDTAIGATGGVAGKVIQEAGGHVINQYARPQLQKVKEAGIWPTVGQSIGGAVNTVEQAASSIPFVGALFGGPRNRAANEWQLSVLNQVVKPLKGEVTETGTQGVSQASKFIGDAYNAAEEAMPTMQITPKVTQSINEAKDRAVDLGMNDAAAKQFNSILDRVLYSRMPKDVAERVGPSQVRNVDEITAANLKKVESELTAKINAKGIDTQLKQALTMVRAAIRKEAGDQSPEYRELIEGADHAYAMFKRVTNAQNADVTDGFTPAQLTRSTMRGASENVAARGDGLMQGDAMAAQEVIGSTLNNSGSAERLAAMTLATGGGAMISPYAALAAPMLGIGGTKSGQKFTNALIENLLAPAAERYTPGSTYGLLSNEVID